MAWRLRRLPILPDHLIRWSHYTTRHATGKVNSFGPAHPFTASFPVTGVILQQQRTMRRSRIYTGVGYYTAEHADARTRDMAAAATSRFFSVARMARGGCGSPSKALGALASTARRTCLRFRLPIYGAPCCRQYSRPRFSRNWRSLAQSPAAVNCRARVDPSHRPARRRREWPGHRVESERANG